MSWPGPQPRTAECREVQFVWCCARQWRAVDPARLDPCLGLFALTGGAFHLRVTRRSTPRRDGGINQAGFGLGGLRAELTVVATPTCTRRRCGGDHPGTQAGPSRGRQAEGWS